MVGSWVGEMAGSLVNYWEFHRVAQKVFVTADSKVMPQVDM
jgi:hypothetical protein